MKDLVISDHFDILRWLLSLEHPDSCDQVLAYVEELRWRLGPGWWDDTLNRAEAEAKDRLESRKVQL